MNQKAPIRLKVGDPVNGIVVKALGGRRFQVKSTYAPVGWKVEMHARKPETVEIGGYVNCWVAKISPLQASVLVHEGDFGRLPISEGMKVRYVAALKAMLGQGELTGDTLADARSMLLRIQQQNQADWLSVWRALGEPATGDVKIALAAIEAMRTARKEAPDALPGLREEFEGKAGAWFGTALGRLDRP